MAATLTELEWRREAARMAVLVADAPPHGIGEGGDQFKQGDPDGKLSVRYVITNSETNVLGVKRA